MLTARDLEARRGRRVLYRSLGFAAAPGQLLRVTGANGAGKTTLLRQIVGLGQPTAGAVEWHGRRIGSQRDAYHRALVYLGHAPALKDDLGAQENLHALCALGGDAVDAGRARAALAAAGLGGRERLPARVLSQGQRRRVGLARLALARDRPLWVLDEPFNALDTAAIDWLAGLLRAHLEGGGLVVLTSHQPVPVDAPGGTAAVAL